MAKFTLKKLEVKVTEDEGNSFEVRGLSPNDISQLLMVHKPVMEQLFAQYAGQDPEQMTIEDISGSASQIAIGVLEQAPGFVAHVIALAADDHENFDDYVVLPMGIQLDALAKIGTLTFETDGGPKKLLGLVQGLMKAKGKPDPNA